MMTPSNVPAASIASADLPLPVGPATIRTPDRMVMLVWPRLVSKPRDAQHILEKHFEEEHCGDAAKQQAHQVGATIVIAKRTACHAMNPVTARNSQSISAPPCAPPCNIILRCDVPFSHSRQSDGWQVVRRYRRQGSGRGSSIVDVPCRAHRCVRRDLARLRGHRRRREPGRHLVSRTVHRRWRHGRRGSAPLRQVRQSRRIRRYPRSYGRYALPVVAYNCR